MKDKILKLRIERSEKTTEKDVEEFFMQIYRTAENLGFNVKLPKNQQNPKAKEERNENS